MSTKAVVIKGNYDELKDRIISPDCDIRNGKWLISLQSVLIRGGNETSPETYSFLVKTNLVENAFLDNQNKLVVDQNCFGVFSVKNLGLGEDVLLNNSMNWFEINCPLSVLEVSLMDPFSDSEKLISVGSKFIFYFLIKKVI